MGCDCELKNQPLARLPWLKEDYYFNMMKQLLELEGGKLVKIKNNKLIEDVVNEKPVRIAFISDYHLSKRDLEEIMDGCCMEYLEVHEKEVICDIHILTQKDQRRILRHTKAIYIKLDGESEK